MQAVGNPPAAGLDVARLAAANINPVTRLATDYLNHFHEAIMLLEMLSEYPDYLDDLLAWRPLSYREHFSRSHFRDRQLAILAYETANACIRDGLHDLADVMAAILRATCRMLRADLPPPAASMLRERTLAWLKSLVAQAGGLINGQRGGDAPTAASAQATVDVLMKR